MDDKEFKKELALSYIMIFSTCEIDWNERPVTNNRKEMADYINTQCTYPPVIFGILDGKDIEPIILREIERDWAT